MADEIKRDQQQNDQGGRMDNDKDAMKREDDNGAHRNNNDQRDHQEDEGKDFHPKDNGGQDGQGHSNEPSK